MTRDEAAKKCPEATAFIAAMREQFGEVKVLYVRENGQTFGKIPAWRKQDEDQRTD
jgi:hypothetical protein